MKVYLGLGSNLGDMTLYLYTAITKIGERIGDVISQSAFYTTAPWGFKSENNFLNAAVCVLTSLSPPDILIGIKRIEVEMGRKDRLADGGYSDRIIDIDLLLYGSLSLQSDTLVIPHPLMTERKFVMEPLAEIAPQEVHPVLCKTMKELFALL